MIICLYCSRPIHVRWNPSIPKDPHHRSGLATCPHCTKTAGQDIVMMISVTGYKVPSDRVTKLQKSQNRGDIVKSDLKK